MTETALAEALANLLRAVDTAPLNGLEIHVQSQVGYEDEDGSVTVYIVGGKEVPEGIGQQFADEVHLRLVGLLPWADTQANRRDSETLCKQLRTILRGDNRWLAAGGEVATKNSDVSWSYGYAATNDLAKRTCQVDVTYTVQQS